MALINIQTNLKSISYGEYQGPNTDTGSPLVTADINKNPSPGAIEVQGVKRVDDLKRITKLLTQTPAALKFSGNNALLSTLEASLKTPDKTLAGKLLSGAGNAVKILASTLAQVPVSGTGLHFVKGFAGKQGYLKGVQGHVQFRNKVEDGLYSDGHNRIIVSGSFDGVNNDGDTITDKPLGKILTTYVNKFTQTITDGRGKAGNFIDPDQIEGSSTSTVTSTNPNSTVGTRDKTKKGKDYKIAYVSKPESRTTKYNQNSMGFDDLGNKVPLGEFPDMTDDFITSLPAVTGSALQDDEKNYQTKDNDGSKYNDLIDFNFKVIEPIRVSDEDAVPNITYLPFRAYLTSFSDNYNSTWNEFNYIGRAESFYNYGGFGRDINFGFQAAASSRTDITPLYDKLNKLAGSQAPTYVGNSFMRGNLVAVTIGDYLNNQIGFISSISFSWETDFIWHTKNMNNIAGYENRASADDLPTILNVEVTFTPIHQQLPKFGAKFIGRRNAMYVTRNESE